MRRRALLAGLATATAGLAGCTGDPLGSDNDRTDSPTDSTPGDSPTDDPETPDEPTTPTEPVQWTVSVSGPAGQPLLAGRSLGYVSGSGPARDRWLFVPTDAGLDALHPGTGEEFWAVPFPEPVQDVAVASGAGVVVGHAGGVELGDDNIVRALDAGGNAVWTFPERGGVDRKGPLELLGADGDRVFVSSRDDQPRPTGETLWALDATDGSVAWRGEVGDASSAVITDAAVFVATRQAVDAFGRPDGRRRWRREFDSREFQYDTLRARGDRAFYATTTPNAGQVHAVDPDGTTAWEAAEYASSVTVTNRLYVGGGSMAALDLDTGEKVWDASSDGYGFLARGPVRHGTLYSGGDGVMALDTADGSREWQWTGDAEITVAADANNGAVFAETRGGDDTPQAVYALNAHDGSERWTFETETELSELALGPHVYVGGADGTLYALDD
jgi:outer membrane protein assembly factor BamB